MSTQVKITRERTSEGPTSSVKTTTYETTSRTSYMDEGQKTYKPTVSGRTTVINRTAYNPVSTSVSTSRSTSYGNQLAFGAPSGAYQSLTATGVQNVKSSRDQEKKDMQDLNERFASYIEKVRFLEAQNRKLADELEKLKQKWGKETTAIKAMYQAELDEARRLLDDAEKEKARLEIRCASLEEQVEELRTKLSDAIDDLNTNKEKIEKQNQQLSDYEAEINLLRRRVEGLESEHEKDKKEIARLNDALNRARIDLDNETLCHIDAENRRQTLEEELEFLKQVHDQEMKELAALAYRDTTAENREFWKNELAQCLREISQTYDDKLNAMRGELETYYNMKIQEFRTGATRQNMESTHSKEENKRLRTQLQDLRAKLNDMEARNAMLEKELEFLRREYEEKEREWESENTELKNTVVKLRAEMEAILKELQDIMDTKLGLELEIAAYRKLLEGEENRVGLRQVVDTITQHMTTTSHSSSGGFSVSGGGGGGSGMASGGGMSGGSGGSISMSSGSYSMSAGGGGMSGGGMSGGMSQQQMYSEEDSSLKVSQVVKGEMSAKTTYQRSAKGPVSVSECSADGKYITVENTSRKDEQLGGWRLARTIDGSERGNFTFDRNFSIRPGGKVKIYAAGARPRDAPASDIECNQQTWGIGANIVTRLVNPANEDRATHIQKTIYTS